MVKIDSLAWQERFASVCLQMHQGHERIRVADGACGGVILHRDDQRCTCGHVGLYHGYAIDYDRIYDSVDATFCPTCRKVTELFTADPVMVGGTDYFLTIMKRRILNTPSIVSELTPNPQCPVCGSVTYGYTRQNLRGTNETHFWRVCANPECPWPGEHNLF